MTEAEWLVCTEPEKLLLFMKGKVSERKLRLVACACCRRIWPLLDGWSQNAVGVSEKYIDGSVGQTAMIFAGELHEDVITKAKPYTPRHIAAAIVNSIISGAAWALAWNTVSEVRRAIRAGSPHADTFQESKNQAALVREIFGNPFRPAILEAAWKSPAVQTISQQIYHDGAFDRLPILADALEDAGCTDQAVLNHCRQPGAHVQGCWLLDMILGKK